MPEELHEQVRGGGSGPPAPAGAPATAVEADDLPREVTAVILAGGASSRMKRNKAFLMFRGERFIERIFRQMSTIFPEVILVTNSPELYRFLPCRIVTDLYPGMGALAGIQAGLTQSSTPYIFVVACDMPDLNEHLVRHLVSRAEGVDVVIPESDSGLEPLHAVYGRGCLGAMNDALSSGRSKIVACFDQLRVTVVSRQEIAGIDPAFRSFRNINTPEEYFRIREEELDSQ